MTKRSVYNRPNAAVRRQAFRKRLRACLASLPDDVAAAASQLASIPSAEWSEFWTMQPATECSRSRRRQHPCNCRQPSAKMSTVDCSCSRCGPGMSSTHSWLSWICSPAGYPRLCLEGAGVRAAFLRADVDRPSIDIDLLVSPRIWAAGGSPSSCRVKATRVENSLSDCSRAPPALHTHRPNSSCTSGLSRFAR